MVFFNLTGMLFIFAGLTVAGCSILAPKYASSAASSNDNSRITLVFSTKRGSLL